MINRINSLPEWDNPSAEMIKIDNLYRSYREEIQLFMQAETGAVISLLNKDVIISGRINAMEVKKFFAFIKPESVFSSQENLKQLFDGFESVNVIICEKPSKFKGGSVFNDYFSSEEMYSILNYGGFSLPPYEYFATDYCRRLNHGLIKVFGKKDTCAAIILENIKFRLLSGIVTKQKGLGSSLLLSAVSGDIPVLSICRDELLPFYIKFGFKPLYKAGYWRK